MTLPGPHTNGSDRDPVVPEPGPSADASLAERLRALGLGEAGHPGDDPGGTERPLTRLTGLGADQGQRLAAQLDTLSAGMAAQADRLRDAERSLVDRIADVDDDRRRTQGQIQRAMQSQYDELDGRLRRLGGLLTLGLFLIAALAAGGLFLLHWNHQQRLAEGLGELQGDLMAEVQTLGLEVGRLTRMAEQGRQVEDRLAALSATLARVAEDQTHARAALQADVAPPEPVAQVARQIAELQADQQRLVAEIDALRTTREAEAAAARSRAPVGEALTRQIAELQAEQQRLIAEIDTLRTTLADPRGDQSPSRAKPAEPVQQTQTEQTSQASRSEAAGSPREPDPGPDPGTPSLGSAATAGTPGALGQAGAAEQSFALQLMGSYERDAVLRLAARGDLPASVYLRQETLRGRPWFVLIHSLHPSYAEAEAARDRLPGDLARLDTWIRKLPPSAALDPIRTGPSP